MKRSTVLSLKNFKWIQFVFKNKISILILLLIIIGIVFGVFLLPEKTALKDLFEKFFKSFILIRDDSSFLKVFLNSFSNFLMVFLCFFIFGSSLLGVIIVPIFALINGFIFGSVSAYVCLIYSLKGVAFNALILVPPVTFFLIVLVFAAKSSFLFSLQIAKLTLNSKLSSNLFFSFKGYCTQYCVYALLCVVVAFIDAVLSTFLLKFFSFN